MFCKSFRRAGGVSPLIGILLALGVCALTTTARADDTQRLDSKGDAPAMTLGFEGDEETLPVRGWRWGYYRYGYYPRYYSYYYPRYYYPRYAYGYAYSYYRPYGYYAPGVIYRPAPCFSPISISVNPMPYAVMLPGRARISVQFGSPEVLPAPQSAPDNGTYPYDGGPRTPVPLPKADPGPGVVPPVATIVEGRVISLATKPAKYAYPAYGEQPGKPDPSLARRAGQPK